MSRFGDLETEAAELRRLGDAADPDKVERNRRARMREHDRFWGIDTLEERERRARYLGGLPRGLDDRRE